MRKPAVAFLCLSLVAAGQAVAQSQGWSVTPFAAYTMPSGNLVEGPFLEFEPSSGMVVGLNGEVGLAKMFAIQAFAASTIGLTTTAQFRFTDPVTPANNQTLDFANAWTQFGATAIIRPLGRLPNGAPKVFWLEGGAAMTRFSLADVQDPNSNARTSSWSSNYLTAVFGGGVTIRLTPRMTAIVFGRYSMALSEYESDGLTDWNAPCGPTFDPTCVDAGQKVNLLQVGVGIRAGR